MGFLDNVTSAVNRGTAAAGRGADKIKLRLIGQNVCPH